MLADCNSLADETVQVLRQFASQTIGAQNSGNRCVRYVFGASDSVLITQDLADSRRQQTLLSQVTDDLGQHLWSRFVERLGNAHLRDA